MAKHTKEFKNKVLHAYKKNPNLKELSEEFNISQSSVWRWCKEAGLFIPKKIGRKPRLTLEQKKSVIRLKQENPSASLRQIAEQYAHQTGDKKPSLIVLSQALKEFGYTYKKSEKPLKSEEKREGKQSYRYKEKHRTMGPTSTLRRAYPSDLTDSQWNRLSPFFEKENQRGRKRKNPLREYVNAVFYVLRTGCQWRYLPHDFPHWNSVAKEFYRWKKKGIWRQVSEALSKEAVSSKSVLQAQRQVLWIVNL